MDMGTPRLLFFFAVLFQPVNCFFPQSWLNDILPDINDVKNDAVHILQNSEKSLKFINRLSMMKGNKNEAELQAENTFKKPWFCHGLDCPEFTTLKGGKDYEAREYVKTMWFSTNLLGKDLEEASEEMFFKLFNYIDGENVEKKKIKMTAPVINRIIPGQGPACKDNFTMSFFNSPKETNPPKPTDQSVFFSELKTMKVYVSSFSGYANEEKWLKCAAKLAAALEKDGKAFDQEFLLTAGYDSPYRVVNRHNEVWMMATD